MPDYPDNVIMDPLSVGLRLGTAGAAAGLGLAAIHRAIRARQANKKSKEHTSVLKPMLAGAAIGLTLGAGVTAERWRQKNMATKYAGLRTALEKHAALDSYAAWGERHPWLNTGAYFIPGVGAGMAAADTVHSFSKGKVLSGLGNLAMIPLGLMGLGGIARAIPGMARVARAAKATGTGVRNSRAALQGAGALGPEVGRFGRTWRNIGTKLFQEPLAGMTTADTGRWAGRGQRLDRSIGVGRKFDSLKNVPGLRHMDASHAIMAGGTGLSIAGGLSEAQAQQPVNPNEA